MGGVPGGVGFVLRRVFVHWEGGSAMVVIGVIGGRMLGFVRRACLRVKERRMMLA